MSWNRFTVIVSLLVQDLVVISPIEQGPLAAVWDLILGIRCWKLKGVSDHGQVVSRRIMHVILTTVGYTIAMDVLSLAVTTIERITLDHV